MAEQTAARLRAGLVAELDQRGVPVPPEVRAAILSVPRHHFVPGVPVQEAYADRALMVKKGADGAWLSSASQPAIMAIMLSQLQLRPGHAVLEVGTGTGYNAALLSHIVGSSGRVVSLDVDVDLTALAAQRLRSAGYGDASVLARDGRLGAPEAAPFDRVIVTASSPEVAPAWWQQLQPGGRLVLPLSLRGSQLSIAFVAGQGRLTSDSANPCGFIPLQGEPAEQQRTLQVAPYTKLVVPANFSPDAGEVQRWLADRRGVADLGRAPAARELWDLGYWLFIGLPADHGVPAMLRSRKPGRRLQVSFALLGRAGCAVLSVGRGHLQVTSYADAEPEGQMLAKLAGAWLQRGRPGCQQLEVVVVTDQRLLSSGDRAAADVVIKGRSSLMLCRWR